MPLFLHDGAMHYFAHIPKAGGSTVERFVAEQIGTPFLLDTGYYGRPAGMRWSRTSPQHLLWADLVRMVPPALIASVHAVTRHPVRRAASAYNYRVTRSEICVGDGFESWLDRGIAVRARGGFVYDNHLEPQHLFVPEDAVTWRLEDGVDAALGALAARFGVAPGAAAAVENRTPPGRSPVVAGAEPMPPRLVERLAEHYRADLERFGYDPAPEGPVPLLIPRRAGRVAQLRSRAKRQVERAQSLAIRGGLGLIHDFR